MKKKILALVCVILLGVVVAINNIWLYLVTLSFIVFMAANLFVYRKFSYNASHLFSTIDRNYDVLLIGDNCNYEKLLYGKKSICFISPTPRSMQSVTLLVKRLYSLLDENNGELAIVVHQKYREKGINVFDIPYLHENTLRDMGLYPMRYLCRIPMLFSFRGVLNLFCKSKKIPQMSKLDNKELTSFLESRNIRYKFYTLN